MSDRTAISATITGRVQGVGFRFATARTARELGLTGWVRNTATGGVEVWAQGESEALDRLAAFLRVGPPAASVTSASVRPAVPNPAISGFNVRY
jgi:acylphosphatase